MAAGVVFEKCSYSDTRCECDMLFTFEGAEYILTGGCGSTLEFHSVDKALDCWWSMQTDPLNVETVIYRILTRLRGEKIDYSHIPDGQPLVWHHPGMPWPNDWMPPASMDREQDEEGTLSSTCCHEGCQNYARWNYLLCNSDDLPLSAICGEHLSEHIAQWREVNLHCVLMDREVIEK
jgi:hypothetical protein